VVDKCGTVHDQIYTVGQPLPGLGVHAEIMIADITRYHLEVIGRQHQESAEQRGITAVERILDSRSGLVGVAAAYDRDQLAAAAG